MTQAAQVNTVCSFCGVGCGLTVSIRDNTITQVRGDRGSPFSRGRACVKGINGWRYVHRADRLTRPLVRRGGRLEEASWDEALEVVVQGLDRIRRTHGGRGFGMLSSSKATNELNYMAQKFARLVMGSNNIDSCNRG